MDLCLIIIIHFYFILFSGNSLFGTPEFLILALIIIQYNVLKSKKNIEVNYKERAIEK